MKRSLLDLGFSKSVKSKRTEAPFFEASAIEDISVSLCTENHITLEPEPSAAANEININSEIFSPTPSDSLASNDDSVPLSNLDIGLYIGKSSEISDELRLELLNNAWSPDKNYKMPFTARKSKGKMENRHLRHDHLANYSCLAYSHVLRGLFCRYCVLFSGETAGKGSHQKINTLVFKPLQSFDRLFGNDGYITEHIKREYHQINATEASNFENTMGNPNSTIINRLDSAREKQIEQNRIKLKPIIKTVILCGRQGLPLRGHRDDGTIDLNESNVKKCEGNFRALLHFRADAGDVKLAEHLSEMKKNATYISKTTQNELIKSCGSVIQENIIKDINNAKFFTVLADETSDCSRIEQMSLCVRFVHKNVIREEFLQFVHVTDLTGSGLASTIISQLQNLKIDLNYLVGQGYDGASAMSGQFSGVQAEIRKQHPEAVYVHCAAHCLNLCISKSSDVQAIRNSFGIISETINFINASVKRNSSFQANVPKDSRVSKLVGLCETRWVERHDAILIFAELLPTIVNSLEDIATWKDGNASAKAKMLLHSIEQAEFLVALATLEKILGLTINLSKVLQTVNLDLPDMLSLINDTTSTLNNWRNTENTFENIFEKAKGFASKLEVELSVPRITNHQKNRCNVAFSSVEEYFKRSIFLPLLDTLIVELKDRFGSHHKTIMNLTCLIPNNIVKPDSDKSFEVVVNFYEKYLDTGSMLEGEFTLWKKRWSGLEEVPCTALESLEKCSGVIYPNVHKLLQILCTLPVTTSTAERTFSSMKYLKSYLRSTMGQERLTGLALMFIHDNVEIDIDKVIEHFASQNNRRLEF